MSDVRPHAFGYAHSHADNEVISEKTGLREADVIQAVADHKREQEQKNPQDTKGARRQPTVYPLLIPWSESVGFADT